jgi:hypothetical protein
MFRDVVEVRGYVVYSEVWRVIPEGGSMDEARASVMRTWRRCFEGWFTREVGMKQCTQTGRG